MIITYFGKQFFKIQQGDLVITYNPISKDSGYKGTIPRYGSDIVLSSMNTAMYHGIETVTFGDKKPFLIDGPGDYEIGGVMIKGASSEKKGDAPMTVYSLTVENITLGFLTSELPAGAQEIILGADILFLPIDETTMPTSKAYKLAVSLEPSIIIPMESVDNPNTLKQFLKEGGQENEEAVDKITLKKKDLEGKEAHIMVLKNSA